MFRVASSAVPRLFGRTRSPKYADGSHWKHAARWKSTLGVACSDDEATVLAAEEEHTSDYWNDAELQSEIQRLQHIRNVGVFAHVDAGKTTVTERMLALAGVVHRAGSVDEGNTVTDYLPAERERGITISSAAISFPWACGGGGGDADNHVTVSLIDTPGHVDFSVEVNRSVAVLDGAVLVVDSVAGVQAQTETVWRAMTRPSLNNHDNVYKHDHAHEPLPCLALINKMDKEGCNFGNAIKSLKQKLPGANPIPIQMPLFRTSKAPIQGSYFAERNIVAVPVDDVVSCTGDFVGVVDLVQMRAIIYPDHKSSNVANVESCIPDVIPLLLPNSHDPIDENCQVVQEAILARHEFLEAMAECDEQMEEYYLTGQVPTSTELRAALRRVTLSQRGLPVMAAAALRGKGVEPVLDAIADLLPSPLDRQSPELTFLDGDRPSSSSVQAPRKQQLGRGHALHPTLLALAFKVVHMKGRGGSGDGRVVFARVYSGELKERDTVQVISPPAPGEAPEAPRKERVGGMLELSGGRFGNLENGACKSGDVCALIGLKSVVTGDTIMMMPDRKTASSSKRKRRREELVCLAGVAAPKPVLQVRLEAESTEQQKRLSEALSLLAIEDPSLVVEETDSTTLLSGLGELHIEITLDRLYREYGLRVMVGAPSVTYRETITALLKTEGLINYDKSIGGTRLQAAVSLVLEPTWKGLSTYRESVCLMLAEPVISVSAAVKEFLNLDPEASDDELVAKSEVYKALVQGCHGALKRGFLGQHPMANVKCYIVEIDAEGGLSGLQALPGAMRAAAAHAVSTTLSENKDFCSTLEPKMSLEVTLPNDLVGTVLSDLTGSRRGTVGDVIVGEDFRGTQAKALVRGEVPLVEILGYANSLRSLTGGEGAFTAEYKGHSLLG